MNFIDKLERVVKKKKGPIQVTAAPRSKVATMFSDIHGLHLLHNLSIYI